MKFCRLSLLVVLSLAVETLPAQVNARLLRYPDVSGRLVAFVYAGDIWTVEKSGGIARRLSSPRGEESFPRFSPDGSQLAFSANYDGNTDIYVLPVAGGEPRRITYHPAVDRLVDWSPDGRHLLFASNRESGSTRYNQLYRVPVEGGMPGRLPLLHAEFGALSEDGKSLVFQMISLDFRTWKRYRGGMAADLWRVDLDSRQGRNLTAHPANDTQPMWHGSNLYFLSDRDESMRHNLWTMDLRSGRLRQLTHFTDFDLRFPAIGPAEIVFEAGGRLYLFSLQSEKYLPIDIRVVTDAATLRPATKDVSRMIQHFDLSPAGKRAVFEARGEIFSVPAEHGVILNLSNTPGAAERYPVWSPDGRRVAYHSDRGGEYQVLVRELSSGSETVASAFISGFRYRPFWSPDSRKLAFLDQKLDLQVLDLESRKVDSVDKLRGYTHGGLEAFAPSWSPDSRWLAYASAVDNQNGAIFVYDTREGVRHQLTSGYYSDDQPVFDPEGKYLYYLTGRSLSPIYGDVEDTWIYANTTQIAAVPLRADVPYPLAPRNDEELRGPAGDSPSGPGAARPPEVAPSTGGDQAEGSAGGERTAEAAAETRIEEVTIDLEGFERRAQILPPAAGNIKGLAAAPGKVLYLRFPRTGTGEQAAASMFYDLKEREEKTVLAGVHEQVLSADRKKLLVRKERQFAIVDVAADRKFEKPLRVEELEATVDPRQEWRQLYTDAWRLMRDYFYDPGMHGVDWQGVRDHYGRLLEDAVTRWDVDFLIGEMIAELNASHTYKFGGDTEQPVQRGVGLLGADFLVENGAFRVARIIDGGVWDVEVRSPLLRAGVREGEYLLAVNGVPLDTSREVWAAFQGLAGKTVELTVHTEPSLEGSRRVLAETLASEVRLRNLAWIEANRRYVEEATGGRAGYIYVPDTGTTGQTELVRQFRAQFSKDGLIIDERFNGGGQYPDHFVELLNRRRTGYIGFRDMPPGAMSMLSRTGPQVMLINAWAGSGGDLFPYLFREAGLGPLIGTRTWGGLIGISGVPQLIDGGGITAPNLALYGPDGRWLIEGHGVEPDIEVAENPMAGGPAEDAQLRRAVEEVQGLIQSRPPVFVEPPPFDDRTVRSRKNSSRK
jgi:tricorn protease